MGVTLRTSHPPSPAATERRAGDDRPYLLLLVVALTACALLARIEYPIGSGRYLWAEDGHVFFNQARMAGIKSLLTPYAGYLHLYPRVVAWAANDWPLSLQPYAFSGAWFVAFFVMVATITARGRAMGLDTPAVCIVALLTTLQPNSGEVFFNLTNCQWLLGVALTLHVLTRVENKASPWQLLALAIACLTGPFCIVILPLVLIARPVKGVLKRDTAFICVFVACAVIQLVVLLTTERVAGKNELVDPVRLVKGLARLMLFSPTRRLEWICAIGFWTIFGALLARSLAKRELRAEGPTRIVLLLLIAAIGLMAAPLVTGASPLRYLSDEGDRYTWIPYSLVFFSAAMLASRYGVARLAMAVLLAVICYTKFTPLLKYDFQYPSFVKLADVTSAGIPIGPVETPWIFEMETRRPILSGGGAGAASRADGSEQASRTFVGEKAFDELSSRRVTCERASDIALEFDADHSASGTVTLSWSTSSDFSQVASMKRVYLQGPARMQFAFPYPPGGVFLKSAELSDPRLVTLRRAMLFCLP